MTDRERIEALERAVAELCEMNNVAFRAPRRRSFAPTGEANGNAVLTAEAVEVAKRRRMAGFTFVAIGHELGVHESTVRRAVRGTSWSTQ
jgi:hypothetical protein